MEAFSREQELIGAWSSQAGRPDQNIPPPPPPPPPAAALPSPIPKRNTGHQRTRKAGLCSRSGLPAPGALKQVEPYANHPFIFSPGFAKGKVLKVSPAAGPSPAHPRAPPRTPLRGTGSGAALPARLQFWSVTLKIVPAPLGGRHRAPTAPAAPSWGRSAREMPRRDAG